MTKPQGHNPDQQPTGGGSEDNGNVHVENDPEWKNRPRQYPSPSEQIDTDSNQRTKP